MDELNFTDPFTAELINEEPVVFMGLSIKEIYLSAAIGLVVGFLVSVILTMITRSPIGFLLLPLTAVLIPYISSKFIKSIRKGKPPGYIGHVIDRAKYKTLGGSDSGIVRYSLGRNER